MVLPSYFGFCILRLYILIARIGGMSRKQAKICHQLADIRHEIDTIDYQIMDLLDLRRQYIHQAVHFKTSEEGEQGVRVPSRIKSMLKDRCQQAAARKLDPNFIRHLFQQIIDHFVACEMALWRKKPEKNIAIARINKAELTK